MYFSVLNCLPVIYSLFTHPNPIISVWLAASSTCLPHLRSRRLLLSNADLSLARLPPQDMRLVLVDGTVLDTADPQSCAAFLRTHKKLVDGVVALANRVQVRAGQLRGSSLACCYGTYSMLAWFQASRFLPLPIFLQEVMLRARLHRCQGWVRCPAQHAYGIAAGLLQGCANFWSCQFLGTARRLGSMPASHHKKLCLVYPLSTPDLSPSRPPSQNDRELTNLIRRKFAIKCTTGYSLNALVDFPTDNPIEVIKRLMIGSEGTLGFVSQVGHEFLLKKELTFKIYNANSANPRADVQPAAISFILCTCSTGCFNGELIIKNSVPRHRRLPTTRSPSGATRPPPSSSSPTCAPPARPPPCCAARPPSMPWSCSTGPPSASARRTRT